MLNSDYTPKRAAEGGARVVETKGSFVPGIVICLVLAVAEAIPVVFLKQSGMVPEKFLVALILLLVALVALVWVLTHNTARRVRFVLGTLLAVVLVAGMVYGAIAVRKINTTVENITNTTVETAEVYVYVLAEDEAESLSELLEDNFGILEELDRVNTDEAIAMIEQTLSATILTVEYDDMIEMIDALYDGQVRAVVMNSAYVELLEDLDGYTDVNDRIRILEQMTVETVVEVTETQVTEAAEIEDTAFIVYISGSDSRYGLSAKARSDVNILAVVNTETHQVLLVSTPRDYYVELSISNGVKDKLTHAGIYGVQVSMDTLAMLYDIEIEYYFKTCFNGVVDIVDALGGVSVYSEYAFTASNGGYKFTVGYNTVNGEQALGFVRERYAFSSGDRQRGKNQMALIKAVVNKMLTPTILTSYASILDTVSDNIETNIPASSIADLVSQQLEDMADWEIITYSVDGSNSSAKTYSIRSSYSYVMVPDESTVETAKELIAAVMAGEVIEQPEE